MEIYDKICKALESNGGGPELFDRIDETRTSYYDALVWYNPETQKIEVEPVPQGNYPYPDEQRILLHREKAWSSCDDGLEDRDMYTDEELSIADAEFGGDIALFLASEKNQGETLEARAEDARRYYFLESWGETVHEWAEKAAQAEEEAEKEKMIENSLRKDFEAMMAEDES